MITRRNLPENLNDMLFGTGVPMEHSYGYDHAPKLPSGEAAAAAFQEARGTLFESVTRLPGPQFLATLAYLQRSGGAPGGPEPRLAELEFAQALFLTRPAVEGSFSPEDLGRFRQALREEMILFLDMTARAPQDGRDALLRRRQRDTLHVRHTLYPADACAVHRAIADELGNIAAEQLGVPLACASELLFLGADVIQIQVSQWRRDQNGLFQHNPPKAALPTAARQSPGSTRHGLSINRVARKQAYDNRHDHWRAAGRRSVSAGKQGFRKHGKGARDMIGLLFWVVVGAALLFVVPSLIAPYTGGNPIVGIAIRGVGALDHVAIGGLFSLQRPKIDIRPDVRFDDADKARRDFLGVPLIDAPQIMIDPILAGRQNAELRPPLAAALQEHLGIHHTVSEVAGERIGECLPRPFRSDVSACGRSRSSLANTNFNPDAFSVTEVDTRAQVWTYAGGYKRAAISLTVDSKGEIQQARTEQDVPTAKENADRAIFVKMEGWDIPLELRAIAQVSPEDAPCVVAGVGTLTEVEDRVLTPSIRAITRDVAGGTYEVTEAKVDENGKPILDKDAKPVIITVNRPTKALDLINQRPLIEGEIERRIRPEAEKSCVKIREVRLGEPAIPPELLVAVRREQLATQVAKAFIQEQAAQEKRVNSEKAKATADKQGDLVSSEIGVQRSVLNAQAARNEGQGERDKLTMIAEGQKQQKEVLGTDATVRLRQFELALDKVFGFADKHPEVLTSALTNAQKFVPNIQVGASEGGGISGLLTALLGNPGNVG